LARRAKNRAAPVRDATNLGASEWEQPTVSEEPVVASLYTDHLETALEASENRGPDHRVQALCISTACADRNPHHVKIG
jgi:hypothetical protein